MNATAQNGDEHTGERSEDGLWWQYRDKAGNLYESREVPAYRIVMNQATQITTPDGKRGIIPINALQ